MRKPDFNGELSKATGDLRVLIAARLKEMGGRITSRQIEAVIQVVGANLGALGLITNHLVERVEWLEDEADALRSKLLELEIGDEVYS